jgi:hypothetical protein
MKLCTLVGLLIKGSKFVHFNNEIVYIGGFTDERVEVGCTLLMKRSKSTHFTNEVVYTGGFNEVCIHTLLVKTRSVTTSEFLNTFTDEMCTLH